MAIANTPARYGTPARVLHWLTALLILTNLPIGLIANRLAYGTAEAMAQKAQLFSIHKTLGIAAFAVALVRILWALTQVRPTGLHPERRAETTLAEAVHWTLYISLIAVPLTGWVGHAAAQGFAPILWPLGQGLPLVPLSESVASAAHALHWVFTKLLALSILLHIAGALKHHLIDRDATLRRMWRGDAAAPRTPRRATVAPLVMALGVYLAGAAVAVSLTAQPDAVTASVPAAAPAPAATAPVAGAPATAAPTSANTWRVTEGTLALGVVQMGSAIEGGFSAFTADIAYDPETREGTVIASIDITSLTLGSVTKQALEGEFFNAATHPAATFTATIAPAPDSAPTGHIATGTLTLKGATVPVALPFTLTLDRTSARATGSVALERLDFGIGPSFPDEATVAHGVTVTLDLTATRAD